MKPIREFLDTATTQLYGRDFEDAGYILVNHGRSECESEWSDMHKWCLLAFEGNYTWTGSAFWFDRADYAHLFKCLWVWGLGGLARDYPFAIRAPREEYTKYFDTDLCLEVAHDLHSRFGVKITSEAIYQGRWIGLETEQDAMYARLLLPDNVFLDLRELRVGPPR